MIHLKEKMADMEIILFKINKNKRHTIPCFIQLNIPNLKDV